MASDSHLNLGLEQSPIVSKTDMHKAYYCHVCNQVTLIERQSGMMYEHCEPSTCQKSTSSVVASHAKTSALLAEVQDLWQESEAVFTLKLKGLSKRQTQDLYFSKMSQQLELVDLTKSRNHLPTSGMIAGGQLYQPPKLEPVILEKGGFYWPTPSARSAPDCPAERRRHTPSLEASVNMWPTPRASEYKDCGPVGSKSQVHMDKRDYLCAKVKDSKQPTGKLSPMWVEWLMGYQIGWTELSASAMQWFHSKREKRL